NIRAILGCTSKRGRNFKGTSKNFSTTPKERTFDPGIGFGIRQDYIHGKPLAELDFKSGILRSRNRDLTTVDSFDLGED
ncbi:hypothetical protein AVEN_99460-1, partial [Araneus ventricosus]